MSQDDDDNEVETTVTSGAEITLDPMGELGAVFDDLEALLKNGDVIESLTLRHVNASLALVALEGLRAYLSGDKAQAADDLGTVAEEIRGRLAVSGEDGASKPS